MTACRTDGALLRTLEKADNRPRSTIKIFDSETMACLNALHRRTIMNDPDFLALVFGNQDLTPEEREREENLLAALYHNRLGFAPALSPAPAPSPSLGRYAAPGKHVVSAAPQPAASTSALKRLAPYSPPLPPLSSRSATRASSTPALMFTTSMSRIISMMAVRPLTLMPGLKLLQATPAMLKWRTRMRGDAGA
jgi:hypothetical protein